jgi:hypothetical protein
LPLAVAVVAAALAATVIAVIATRSPSRPSTPPRVVPVARSSDAAHQARNLIAWLRRYSAR